MRTKVRYSKCEMCRTRMDMKLLYVVLDRKMCLDCGRKQISIWNAAVKEAKESLKA